MLCRSYKIVADRRFELFIEDVSAGHGEALVKIKYAAICKADIRYYLGKRNQRVLGLKYPMSLIHEAVGTVLKDCSGLFNAGDTVALIPNIVKGDCADCLCQRHDLGQNYCKNALFASSNCDGFSKDIAALSSSNLAGLKDDKPHYVFCELVSVAIAAARRLSLSRDAVAAVFGDGIMGYIMCLVIKTVYNCPVYIIGKHRDRIDSFVMCDKAFYANETDKIAFYNAGFECVGGAGAQSAINSITETVAIGGDIVLLGVSEEDVSINTRRIMEKGLCVKGATRSSASDFKAAVKLFEDRRFVSLIENLILGELHIKNIDDYNKAFEKECENTKIGKHILFF